MHSLNSHFQRQHGACPLVAATRRNAKVAAAWGAGSTQRPQDDLPYGFDLSRYASLAGKTVLVTGSGRGIGLHSAKLLARLGARVIITDMRTEAIHSAVEHLATFSPGVEVVPAAPLDLSSLSNVGPFVSWLHRHDMVRIDFMIFV